jgi:hypothetical protein
MKPPFDQLIFVLLSGVASQQNVAIYLLHQMAFYTRTMALLYPESTVLICIDFRKHFIELVLIQLGYWRQYRIPPVHPLWPKSKMSMV